MLYDLPGLMVFKYLVVLSLPRYKTIQKLLSFFLRKITFATWNISNLTLHINLKIETVSVISKSNFPKFHNINQPHESTIFSFI